MRTYDLYWAAGFLEGEGTFGWYGNNTLLVTASQVNPEPLEKLEILFGVSKGGIRKHDGNKRSWNNAKPIHVWRIHSRKAASVMMTLYPLLSKVRQEQVKKALAGWKSVPGRWKKIPRALAA